MKNKIKKKIIDQVGRISREIGIDDDGDITVWSFRERRFYLFTEEGELIAQDGRKR